MRKHNYGGCGCGQRRSCGCGRRGNEIVHPTRERVVHCCSEEVVRHVHPVHTTVVNHHRIRNEHVYPHTTSEVDSIEEYDVGRRDGNVLGTRDYCGRTRGRRRGYGCRRHGRRRRGCFW